MVVGLDIMLEFREFLKDGMPVSNIIRRKLKSLLNKAKEVKNFSILNEFIYAFINFFLAMSC